MKKFFSKPFIILIRIYQKIISPVLPASCRYSPTCSTYAIQSLKKYNLIKAIYLILIRIFKCHPWSKGGFDPVP